MTITNTTNKNIMKQLIRNFKLLSLFILAISITGCEDDDTLLPKVIAGFTHTINAYTGTVTFINTSENAQKYEWDFGDGSDISTLINPINVYPNGTYTVILKAKNVAGSSDDTFEDEITINIIDEGTPVITLLGDATMNVITGGTFTDPGATATDDVDGDITANIVVAGDTVDVNTEGTYVITYNVNDEYGNAATEVTRTVIVANDSVAPVITLIGSATMNVEIGGTFTDPGATATDDVDGDITDNIVVAGDIVDVNIAATYIITYNVNDAAGNAAAEVTRTVVVATADGGTGDYIYATSATVTIPSTIDDWGSGTAIVSDYSGDATYNPSIQLISGTGWGDVSALAFTEMETGILSNYSTLEFKIKTTDYTTIRVKVPENEISFPIADGTPLANGWVQMSLPLSNWSNEVGAANQFAILEFGAGTILITDVMLSGEGSGGGGGCEGCSIDGIAENGDFETGNLDGWAVYENGGSITIDDTQSSGGAFSAKLYAFNGGNNPTLKQERKGAGTISVGDQVQVTFDYMGSLEGESGVFSFQSFVEAAAGVNQVENFAVTPTDTWQTFTTTYTVNAGDISGGITLEFVAICGGVDGCFTTLYLDNVSIIINP